MVAKQAIVSRLAPALYSLQSSPAAMAATALGQYSSWLMTVLLAALLQVARCSFPSCSLQLLSSWGLLGLLPTGLAQMDVQLGSGCAGSFYPRTSRIKMVYRGWSSSSSQYVCHAGSPSPSSHLPRASCGPTLPSGVSSPARPRIAS